MIPEKKGVDNFAKLEEPQGEEKMDSYRNSPHAIVDRTSLYPLVPPE